MASDEDDEAALVDESYPGTLSGSRRTCIEWVNRGAVQKRLPDQLLCQVMPIAGGSVSKTEPLDRAGAFRATVTFPRDFSGMRFGPGHYHYWWTTRTRRHPELTSGPELAGGAFHYDGRYRVTFRQRQDESVSLGIAQA